MKFDETESSNGKARTGLKRALSRVIDRVYPPELQPPVCSDFRGREWNVWGKGLFPFASSFSWELR